MLGKFTSQGLEDVRTGLEQIFVEIVFTSLTAAKDKVTFQISSFLYSFY
jgi:hypothetical protein